MQAGPSSSLSRSRRRLVRDIVPRTGSRRSLGASEPLIISASQELARPHEPQTVRGVRHYRRRYRAFPGRAQRSPAVLSGPELPQFAVWMLCQLGAKSRRRTRQPARLLESSAIRRPWHGYAEPGSGADDSAPAAAQRVATPARATDGGALGPARAGGRSARDMPVVCREQALVSPASRRRRHRAGGPARCLAPRFRTNHCSRVSLGDNSAWGTVMLRRAGSLAFRGRGVRPSRHVPKPGARARRHVHHVRARTRRDPSNALDSWQANPLHKPIAVVDVVHIHRSIREHVLVVAGHPRGQRRGLWILGR